MLKVLEENAFWKHQASKNFYKIHKKIPATKLYDISIFSMW